MIKYKTIASLIILFFAITSCNQDKIAELENQLSQAKSELEEARNKISEIQSYVNNMESAVSELRSEVDDFSYENWQYNVPDVDGATRNVESTLDDLKSVAY